MKAVDVDATVEKTRNFLKEKGVKMKNIDVWGHDKVILIQFYTNIPSMRKATEIEVELWTIIPDEEVSIIIFPKD